MVDYSLIAPEASMATKKTSGGNSPLRQDARKSFYTLPILGRRWRRIVMCFWKIDRVLMFFPLRGLYRRRGVVRSGPGHPHHRWAWPGAGPRPLVVRLAPSPSPCHLRSLRSFGKNRRFGFCFVQFGEYFLCNFSETQKQQKTGN
jgi:hypothetical protein